MAINKRKVLETARKHVQKGAQAKALKEFEKLLKADPRDARLRLEVGDAHRRWGNVEEAIETYRKVADQYTKEGFDARAVAVYKQIHNLDPEAFETYEPLAELYQRMGLTIEAIGALQTAADGFRKSGKKREALELLRRMATLDPSNTTSRIKVADLLRQEGLVSEAVDEYTEACAELERQGDREGVATVCERILEIDPNRFDAVGKLSESLIGRGMADRAEPLVRRALDADRNDPARYELMASVYRAQGRDEELVSTYRALSEVYRERGDEEHARDILQRFVPSDDFATELGIDETVAFGAMGNEVDLGESGTFDRTAAPAAPKVLDDQAPGQAPPEIDIDDIAEATQFDPSALERPGQPKLEHELLTDLGGEEAYLDIGDDDGEEISLELDQPVAPAPAPPPAPAAAVPVGDPDQLLAEASVYLRYGKREQAIENLEAIVAQIPGHGAALEKLGEAHAESGDGARAVTCWLKAAEVARETGDDAGLAVLRDRIAAIDAAAAAAIQIDAPEPRAPEPAAPAAESREIDLDDIEVDLDEVEIEIDASDFEEDEPGVPETDVDTDDELMLDESEVSADGDAALEEGPNASSSMVQQINEDLEEAEFYMKQGLADEAEAIFKRVLSIAPNHPHALVRLGEVAALKGGDPNETGPDLDADAVADTATDGVRADADEDFLTFDEDIADPGDLDLEAAEAPAPVPTDPALDADTELEDDLAEQFLSEVTGDGDSDAGEAGDALDLAVGDEAADVTPPIAAAGSRPDPDLSLTEPTGAADGADAAVGIGADAEERDGDAADDAAAAERSAASPADSGDREDALAARGAADAGADFADPEAVPDLSVPAAEGGGFDLAAELNDVFDPNARSGSVSGLGDSADGFAALFNDFKKGVDKTLGADDHEARFDLGIAYREMGLYDDAKAEFRAAMRSPAREIECRHMLGLCCYEQGAYEEAVGEFEQIAAAESANAEQTLSAQFELGRAWEALGDTERARSAYDAVAAIDPGFCEVSTRLASLDEPEKPEAVAEEDFESFEDLMGDSDDDDGEIDLDADASDAGDDADGPDVEVTQPEYESFGDLLADGESAADWLDGSDEADDDAPDSDDDRDGGSGAEAAAEESPPDAEPEPDDAPEPAPKPARKRKKISFV